MNPEAAKNSASALAASGFRRPGMTPLVQALSKISRSVEEEITALEADLGAECRKGCSHCCHRLIPVSNVEAGVIAQTVLGEWGNNEREALAARIEGYEEATRFARANPLETVRVPCPFLVEDACSIYECRPWYCRGQASKSASACQIWKESPIEEENQPRPRPYLAPVQELAFAAGEGIMAGADGAGGRSAVVELGLAIGLLLKAPGSIEAASRNADYLAPAIWAEGFRPRLGEPFGLCRFDPAVSKATEDIRLARPGMKKLLPEPGMDAQRALFMLQMPVAPDTEDEIVEARERYSLVLDRLLDMDLDSGGLFDALGRYEAITLPYQGYVDRDLNAKFGDLVTRHAHRAIPELGKFITPRKPDGKFRVGFLSATLENHQASRWAIGFFKDPPADVETYAFQVGTGDDAMTDRWRRTSHRFFKLQGSVPEAGRFIRSLDLDVMVHLDPQEKARSKQFATLRLAPLQVTMWGTPFTCGFPELTHYLSSDAMEPPEADVHYSEKLVRLPGFGLCYDRGLISPPVPFDRGNLGPGPQFLIAQNTLKLLPRRDEFFRKCSEVIGNPLLIIDYDNYITERVKQRFARAGVAARWLPKMSGSEFGGLLAAVDGSLDSPDWNGSNTTMEAFLGGTPVISTPGIHLRGRHTLGFLKVLGAEDLIASDEETYLDQLRHVEPLRERIRALPVEDLFDRQDAKEIFYETLRQLTREVVPGHPA